MNQYERAANTAIYFYSNSIDGYRAEQLGFNDAADLRLIIAALCEKERRETGKEEAQHLIEIAEGAIIHKPATLTHCPICKRKL